MFTHPLKETASDYSTAATELQVSESP